MKRLFRILLLGLLLVLAAFFTYSCSDLTKQPTPTGSVDSIAPDRIPVYTYKVVSTYPHDRNAYTQGLVFENGVLYEGTGLQGHSTLRKVDLETGDILQIRELPAQFFGEGVTI